MEGANRKFDRGDLFILLPAPFHVTPRGFAGPDLLAMNLLRVRPASALERQRKGIDLSLSTRPIRSAPVPRQFFELADIAPMRGKNAAADLADRALVDIEARHQRLCRGRAASASARAERRRNLTALETRLREQALRCIALGLGAEPIGNRVRSDGARQHRTDWVVTLNERRLANYQPAQGLDPRASTGSTKRSVLMIPVPCG